MIRQSFILILLCATLTAAEAELTQVGAAKIDITPAEPVRLTGYGDRKTEYESVEQHIFARAIAIGEKENSSVLVAVENCGITADIVEIVAARLLKERKIPRERLVVCSTHTHTAPSVTRFAPIILQNLTDEQKARVDAYTKWVTEKIGDAAIAALEARKPAKLTWAEGNLGFAGNRRALKDGAWTGFGVSPNAPVQHRLPALRAVDNDGKLVALVINYACHCTTLTGAFNKVCGDWAGYAAEYVEADHPGAISLITIGCGADANPNPRGNLDMAKAHGRSLATEIDRMLKNAWRDLPAKIDAKFTTSKLPLSPPLTKEQFQAVVDAPKGGDAAKRHARGWIERLERNEPTPDHVVLPVANWSFAETLTMVFLGGEVVVDYDTFIRERYDPARLWISSYSNDVPCYIPSKRILKEGGYEAVSSMIYYDRPVAFAPGVEDAVLGGVQQVVPKAFVKVGGNDTPKGEKDPRNAGPNTPPPLSPEDALKSIRVKPGFKVELVACEPLVESPICFDWAPDGKLWVVEMRDYPLGMDGKGKPGGRVKILTDKDGDGRFDEAKVFLDELICPSAIKVWRDGAIVMEMTNVFFARDTDGDGKADERTVLFDGFNKGNQQHLANSLCFRLDGGLQIANGDSGGKIRSLKLGTVVDLRGRDLSIMPDSGVIEGRSGQTQFGTSRDDWDNWFGGNNSYPMWHYGLDDKYLSRNPNVTVSDSRTQVSVDPGPARVYPVSQTTARFNDFDRANRFTSACSPIIYRDTLLPGLEGNSFVCEPVHNLVHREIVSVRDVTFTSKRADDEKESEFFASTDNWCRPVNVKTGPDGALWIADMYRYVIEHPQWIPHESQRVLNLRAGETCGRIYRVVPEKGAPLAPRLDKLDTAGLVEILKSSNGTLRDMAHQMLIWKNDQGAAAPLRELVKSAPLPQSRVQALCVLDCLSAVQPDEVLTALADKHPGVRRHAIRIAERLTKENQKVADAMLALEKDDDAQVQLQLAYSLGASPRSEFGRALGRMATRVSPNSFVSSAIMSSALPHLESMLDEVLDKPEKFTERSALIGKIFSMAVALSRYDAVARVLSAIASTEQPVWRFTLLATFLDGLRQRGINLADYMQNSPALTAQKAGLDSAFAAARKTALDAAAPIESRVIAARLLGRDAASAKADLDVLEPLIGLASAPEIQLEAVAALSRIHDARANELMFSDWKARTPAVRRAVIDSLLSRQDSIEFLLDKIKATPALASAFDTPRRQRLLGHADENIRKRAAEVFAVNQESDRAKVVAQFESVLRLYGEPRRGKEIFGTVCATCHKLEGVGKAIGPDLMGLNDKSPSAMLVAILDPNRAVEDRYVQYVVTTKDGVSLVGKIESENANGITLLGVDGEPRQLLRRDLASIKSTGISLMPEGLEQQLDAQKLADVISYLSHVVSPPKKVDGNEPKLIEPAADGTLTLLASNAEIYGGRLIFEAQFKNLGFWERLDDQAKWSIRVDQPGRYKIEIEYACAEQNAGNPFLIAADQAEVKSTTASTGTWENYAVKALGEIELRKGFHRLTVRPDGKLNRSLMDLRTVRLIPAK